jgi:hypothetical protein
MGACGETTMLRDNAWSGIIKHYQPLLLSSRTTRIASHSSEKVEPAYGDEGRPSVESTETVTSKKDVKTRSGAKMRVKKLRELIDRRDMAYVDERRPHYT